jgi:hypothetical protein
MAASGSPLLLWLRRQPSAAKIRVRLDGGEERLIDASSAKGARGRWKRVEANVMAYPGVVAVEKLDKDGDILEAFTGFEEEEEREGLNLTRELAAADERKETSLSRDRRELALVLDRYGDRLNEAFDRGAAAAAASAESLTTLVETLTNHLSLAITNLHNVSVNLANIVQAQGSDGEDGTSTKLLGQVLGAVAAKAMTGGGNASPPDNGKAGKR